MQLLCVHVSVGIPLQSQSRKTTEIGRSGRPHDKSENWKGSGQSWLKISANSEPINFKKIPKNFNRTVEQLLLNNYELKGENVYAFPGDLPVLCKNLSPLVVDLGLIFDPIQISAKMRHVQIAKSDVLEFDSDIAFLFAKESSFLGNATQVKEGDSLRVDGPMKLEIGPVLDRARLILVEMKLSI